MADLEERCAIAQADIQRELINLIGERGYGKEALPFIDLMIRESIAGC